MQRYYVEQRAWLLGAELTGPVRVRDHRLTFRGADLWGAATVESAHEEFSNFDDDEEEFDHLRVDFDPGTTAALRERLGGDPGFRLERMVPRVSAYGYLSLTSVFALDDAVPLAEVERRGVDVAMAIERLQPVLADICAELEAAELVAFPYDYRFGVPAVLEGSEHDVSWTYSFYQHVLLPGPDALEAAVPALGLDADSRLLMDGFHAVRGRTVFLWSPACRDPAPEAAEPPVERFSRLVLLDNVALVRMTVLAAGLSAANAFLRKVLRGDAGVTAWDVRRAGLVHHRIDQRMKLRVRELLDAQTRYVDAQFERSDYDDLRGAHDRAEAALLSAAEGIEARRQQETSAWTNFIVSVATVLGALAVFTAVIDFGRYLQVAPTDPDLRARRLWLSVLGLLLLLVTLVVAQLVLNVRAWFRRRAKA